MAFTYLILLNILFVNIWRIHAFPWTKPPLHQHNHPELVARSAQNASLQLGLTYATISSVPLLPNEIFCFDPMPGRRQTDIDGCRPTLNEFRTWPLYRLVQDFQEGLYPRKPTTPPFAIHKESANCAVQVKAADPSIVDRFSYEQVRALAYEIVEDCQSQGGVGGMGSIGRGIGWTVTVIGYPPSVGTVNGSVVLEEGGTNRNTTLLAYQTER
ncbi:hypothetical protein MMC28_011367 [Mycoblastus sanguinarius]|nr:hypothetical protein [Mycoblastus sanguinarius]